MYCLIAASMPLPPFAFNPCSFTQASTLSLVFRITSSSWFAHV
jgi:hypothetical protein